MRIRLVDALVKCFNNYVEVDKASDETQPMFGNVCEYIVLQAAFDKNTEHPLKDVFIALSGKIDAATGIDTLVNLAEYSSKCTSQQAAGFVYQNASP